MSNIFNHWTSSVNSSVRMKISFLEKYILRRPFLYMKKNREKEIEESGRVNLFFYYRLSTQFMVSLQVWLWYCSDLHILMWSNFTINIPSFILGRRLSMYRPKLSKTLDCRIFVDFNTWKKITRRLKMTMYIYV